MRALSASAFIGSAHLHHHGAAAGSKGLRPGRERQGFIRDDFKIRIGKVFKYSAAWRTFSHGDFRVFSGAHGVFWLIPCAPMQQLLLDIRPPAQPELARFVAGRNVELMAQLQPCRRQRGRAHGVCVGRAGQRQELFAGGLGACLSGARPERGCHRVQRRAGGGRGSGRRVGCRAAARRLCRIQPGARSGRVVAGGGKGGAGRPAGDAGIADPAGLGPGVPVARPGRRRNAPRAWLTQDAETWDFRLGAPPQVAG